MSLEASDRDLFMYSIRWRWLKKLFSRPQNDKKLHKAQNENEYEVTSKCKILDERKRQVLAERERIRPTSSDWFNIDSPEIEGRKTVCIYEKYEFDKVLTLKELKEQRLHQELIKLRRTEERARLILVNTEQAIKQHDLRAGQKCISEFSEIATKIKDESLKIRFRKLRQDFNILKDEAHKEELRRNEEERRRREEQKRKKQESERKAREEKARNEREEQIKKEAAARRLAEEVRRKEEEKRKEKERLERLSSELKDNWRDFKDILNQNGIRYLYHFTDKSNIISIKRHGGLLSWHYCHTHNITIPYQGGDCKSQELDLEFGLEDYVRLSFCEDHPMAYRLKQEGRNIVILKIKIDVAFLRDTLFSDMNAADKRHTHGKSLECLKMVNFDATRMRFLRNDDPNFKPHQAEVMVKTFVPKTFILNLDSF